MHFILRFRKKSRKATNASKTIINKREAKNNARKAKETKVETKRTKIDTRANAKANAKIIATTTTITTTTTNRKQLLKLREQFACTHVSLVLKTTSILLNCLLLFNNSREYANNTLYNQKLAKLLNQFCNYFYCD